jgi:hypothetical protein
MAVKRWAAICSKTTHIIPPHPTQLGQILNFKTAAERRVSSSQYQRMNIFFFFFF